MVRRPASVLRQRRRSRPRRGPGPVTLAFALPLAAFVYFLAAPALPALPAGDATYLVAGGIGLLFISATTLSLLPARDTLISPLLIALGSGLLVAALNLDGENGVGAGANVFEALLAGALGLLLARFAHVPRTALAVPLFVAALDVLSVWRGPTSQLLANGTARVDPLSFDLPAWGHMGNAGYLGFSDAVFLTMFAAWASRHGFRRTATIAGMIVGLLAALVLEITLDHAIPALPLIAAGYLLPNLDRIGPLLHHQAAEK